MNRLSFDEFRKNLGEKDDFGFHVQHYLETSVMGFDCLYFRADQVVDCSIFCDSIAAGAMDEQKRVQDSTLNA